MRRVLRKDVFDHSLIEVAELVDALLADVPLNGPDEIS